MLVASFDYNEIALIVSGIQELNLCSSVSAAAGFVCHSISEAVERFTPKKKPTEEPKKNPALVGGEEKKSKKKESENPSNS